MPTVFHSPTLGGKIVHRVQCGLSGTEKKNGTGGKLTFSPMDFLIFFCHVEGISPSVESEMKTMLCVFYGLFW